MFFKVSIAIGTDWLIDLTVCNFLESLYLSESAMVCAVSALFFLERKVWWIMTRVWLTLSYNWLQIDSQFASSFKCSLKCLLLLEHGHFSLTYEAVSEWVTERVLREDKSHSTGLKMSDP